MKKINLEFIYKFRIGGTADTLSLLMIAFAFLLSTPLFASFFSSTPFFIIPLFLSLAGSAWLIFNLIKPLIKTPIFKSNFLFKSDLSPYTPPPGENINGFLIGYTCDTGSPIYIDDEHITRHAFIVGQSGVGKTVLALSLIYQQIQRGGGLLFIDGKIDAGNLEQIYQFCCLTGRQHDLYVINPDDPDNSNTYNPVLYGDADEKADGILQLIPSTESNAGSDYYKQEAKQALTTLIRALQTARLAYNMIDLTVLLMNGNAMLELERKLAMAAPGSDELREFSLFINKFRPTPTPSNPFPEGLDDKKIKDVFGGIGGRLYSFGTGKFGQIMNTYIPDLNLYEAIKANKIVYIALPTMGKDTTARNFGRLVIADLRTSISWLQKLPKEDRPNPPFMAFCDEAGSYVNDSWSRIPEQSRSAGVFFMPAVQTLANFKSISEELSEMVIGNTWVKYFFKVGTQQTAEECADLIGKKIGVLKSLADTRSESASSAFLRSSPDSNVGAGSSMNAGERQQEMHIVSPDDLKSLGKGECIMTYGSDQIFHIKIPMIIVDNEYKKRFGLFRPNRFRNQGLVINGVKWTAAGFFDNVERYLSRGRHRGENEVDGESVPTRKYKSNSNTPFIFKEEN